MSGQEALNKISKMMPPPENPTFPQNGATHIFGVPSLLPSDYQQFIERYGIGSICCNGRLRLANISTESSYAMSAGECLKDLMEEGFLPHESIFPDQNGLLAWGDDEENLDFFWRTDTDVRKWHVTYFDRVRFHATELSFTQFLLAVLSNRINIGHPYGNAKRFVYLPHGKRMEQAMDDF